LRFEKKQQQQVEDKIGEFSNYAQVNTAPSTSRSQ
jgi:hypothetical protein